MKIQKCHLYRFFSILVAVVFLTCSKDSTQPLPTSPALPPQGSFLIDFSDFDSKENGMNLPKVGNNVLQTYENWGWSALNVAVWNTIIYVNLAIPVAAFRASFLHQPVLQPDGSWLWTYPFNALNNSYTAELYGTFVTGGTHWDMYISRAGGFQKFLWYSGGSDSDYTHGEWLLYKHPDNPVAYIEIEWVVNREDSTGQITYTHVEGGDLPTSGSYITYGHTLDLMYDRFYQIFNATASNLTDIQWNSKTKEGRVRDASHFQNESWHCWNESLEDTECP